MEKEVEGVPEDGDIYSSGTGEHVGHMDVTDFDLVKTALHLQVKVGGEWYVYQLCGIEKIGEEKDA